MTIRVLALAGSLRADSFNRKLVLVAARGAEAAGAEVTHLDLRDHPLPLFDQDLEARAGLPQGAMEIKRQLKAHQGLLIAAPEYNSSITAVLKNTIDWASRPAEGEAPLECFTGKIAALMAASPGGLGGLRGLVTVRAILSSIGVVVLPDQRAISGAMAAFDDHGDLKDQKQRQQVESLGAQVAEFAAKIHLGVRVAEAATRTPSR